MNITLIIGNYKNGGVATRATNLANEFSKRDCIVNLLACGEVTSERFLPLEKNVKLIKLDDFYEENKDEIKVKKDSQSNKSKTKIYKNLRFLTKNNKKLDQILSDKVKSARKTKLRAYYILNPDEIYIAFGLGNFENIYYAALGSKAKIIYAEKNAAELELPSDIEERRIIFQHMKMLSASIVQTHDELKQYKEAQLDNLYVINNPLKVGLPEPYCGERRKTVVNFCRISKQKNLPLLFDAFEIFHSFHPDYVLKIYGNTVAETEDKLREELLNLIIKSGRDRYIKFLPPSGSVHEKIKDCAMFVSSSDYEGLSNSMIEAMAIGLPCVCTDCLGGGTREVITDGDNGLIVPMNDPEAMAEAMAKIADDKELSEKLSKNAAKIRLLLSADKIAEKWLEVIKKV